MPTETEQLVYEIAKRSFFAPWSFIGPVRTDNGKELCDVLSVVPPDVIVFSVKDISPKIVGEYNTDAARWHRRAVEESLGQLEGAKRTIQRAVPILDQSGSPIKLPPLDEMKLRCVGVAFGSQAEYYVRGKLTNESLMYVLDGSFIEQAIAEIDTIVDFTRFLDELSAFAANHQIIADGCDFGLLSKYLLDGRTFLSDGNAIQLVENRWGEIASDPRYKRQKELDQVSYLWDELLTNVLNGSIASVGATPVDLASQLSRISRLHRRALGAFLQVCYIEPDSDVHLPYLLEKPGHTRFLFESNDFQGATLEQECIFLCHRNKELERVVAVKGSSDPGVSSVTSACVVLSNSLAKHSPISNEVEQILEERFKEGQPQKIEIPEFIHLPKDES